ncbi:MAG: hydantoinase/oxoprolinase, partial [Candidatus Eremiobacteraeota bacterium]|nr:hydantoinase/oxoprolinase [Candidatus Eremiobacteraeota bacterium]
MSHALRIGVDVGGTFTDVVALDARTRELVASVKVPTTHAHARGVAAGIVEGIERLLRESGVDPSDVGFIAHSTTQATNALLEGDLARVGVVGLLDGLGWLAKPQIAFRPFDVAAGARFAPHFCFARATSIDGMREAVETLQRAGCEAFAASQPFGVDDGVAESRCVAFARERGLPATSGHEVSSMYGLRARTRTAALNAAILPKMIETARMTGAAVQAAKIETPLMIMRSDGGVMNARDVERRPILTLLSGPAAGVAGALLHESVTDGVFIEVGGTSSDCSAIRAGRPQMRSANIGGHQTMLRTVDVRTLGIGGGSLARVPEHGCVDAGPRSAHIAGLRYATFCALEVFDGASVTRFSPTAHDPADYVQILARDGTKIGVTVTCA